MSDLDNRLLRDDLNDSLKILNCTIDIFLEDTNYKTATYLYKYFTY